MRTTIDSAGRVVIPKPLRDQIGLQPGEVDIVLEGSGLHIEPVSTDRLAKKGGRLVIPASRAGVRITDEVVSALRHADQR